MNLIDLVKDLKRENEFSLTHKEKTWLSVSYNATKGRIVKKINEDCSLGEYTEVIVSRDSNDYTDDIRDYLNHLIKTDNEFGLSLSEHTEKWAKGSLRMLTLTFNEKQARAEMGETSEFINAMQNIEV